MVRGKFKTQPPHGFLLVKSESGWGNYIYWRRKGEEEFKGKNKFKI